MTLPHMPRHSKLTLASECIFSFPNPPHMVFLMRFKPTTNRRLPAWMAAPSIVKPRVGMATWGGGAMGSVYSPPMTVIHFRTRHDLTRPLVT
jgi:hypothetical protein